MLVLLDLDIRLIICDSFGDSNGWFCVLWLMLGRVDSIGICLWVIIELVLVCELLCSMMVVVLLLVLLSVVWKFLFIVSIVISMLIMLVMLIMIIEDVFQCCGRLVMLMWVVVNVSCLSWVSSSYSVISMVMVSMLNYGSLIYNIRLIVSSSMVMLLFSDFLSLFICNFFQWLVSVLMIFRCLVCSVGSNLMMMLIIMIRFSFISQVGVGMCGGSMFMFFGLIVGRIRVVRFMLIRLLRLISSIDFIIIRVSMVLFLKFSVFSVVSFGMCLCMVCVMVLLVNSSRVKNIVFMIEVMIMLMFVNCLMKVCWKVDLVWVLVLWLELVEIVLIVCVICEEWFGLFSVIVYQFIWFLMQLLDLLKYFQFIISWCFLLVVSVWFLEWQMFLSISGQLLLLLCGKIVVCSGMVLLIFQLNCLVRVLLMMVLVWVCFQFFSCVGLICSLWYMLKQLGEIEKFGKKFFGFWQMLLNYMLQVMLCMLVIWWICVFRWIGSDWVIDSCEVIIRWLVFFMLLFDENVMCIELSMLNSRNVVIIESRVSNVCVWLWNSCVYINEKYFIVVVFVSGLVVCWLVCFCLGVLCGWCIWWFLGYG